MIKDSGKRREFEGGSVRDIQTGKGREDLLPLREIADIEIYLNQLNEDTFLSHMASYTETLDEQYLYKALNAFSKEVDWNIYNMFMEVAVHYEEGAEKYDENNWRKVNGGIPAHCYIDSGIRHYFKFKQNITDERHDRAVVWNVLGLLYTIRNLKDKDDLDFYRERIKANNEGKKKNVKSKNSSM